MRGRRPHAAARIPVLVCQTQWWPGASQSWQLCGGARISVLAQGGGAHPSPGMPNPMVARRIPFLAAGRRRAHLIPGSECLCANGSNRMTNRIFVFFF